MKKELESLALEFMEQDDNWKANRSIYGNDRSYKEIKKDMICSEGLLNLLFGSRKLKMLDLVRKGGESIDRRARELERLYACANSSYSELKKNMNESWYYDEDEEDITERKDDGYNYPEDVMLGKSKTVWKVTEYISKTDEGVKDIIRLDSRDILLAIRRIASCLEKELDLKDPKLTIEGDEKRGPILCLNASKTEFHDYIMKDNYGLELRV